MDSIDKLHFTGTVWRPPYEAYSVLLQVTVGCTHAACRFCSLYDGLRFRMSPLGEVEADLRIAARWQPRARRVFLVGANPFAMSYGRLVRIADLIHDYLPKAGSIGMFARVADIRGKSVAELRDLRARGVTGLTIGTETGDDPSLAYMNKGTTADDTLRQCRKLDEAGIEYCLTYMTGLAGAGAGERAARATARLFNRLHPTVIGVVSLTLFPESALWDDVRSGAFREAGEKERLRELRTFVEELTIPVTLMANTVSNAVPQLGRLPEDRARLLRELDEAAARVPESELAARRRSIVHL